VALGVGPFFVVPLLGRVVASMPGLHEGAALQASGGSLTGLPPGVGQISAPGVALGLIVIAVVVFVVVRATGSPYRVRYGDTWGCGRLVQTPRMQYTATAFAEPLRRVFAELYRPTEDLTIDVHPESKYFVRGISYQSGVPLWLERLVYAPVMLTVRRAGRAARSLQAGSTHLYLAYMCAALIALLVAARWLP
jgi:hydrogenase-4 component B